MEASANGSEQRRSMQIPLAFWCTEGFIRCALRYAAFAVPNRTSWWTELPWAPKMRWAKPYPPPFSQSWFMTIDITVVDIILLLCLSAAFIPPSVALVCDVTDELCVDNWSKKLCLSMKTHRRMPPYSLSVPALLGLPRGLPSTL